MDKKDVQKSFKPLKKIEKGTKGYELKKLVQVTLGSGNMELAVELPRGEDLNEWLAVNTIEFYNEINIIYGTLLEFCSVNTCPIMSAGPKFEYRWAEGPNIKAPIQMPACEYIDHLMAWIEGQLNNEKLFPCQVGIRFPDNFQSLVKIIFKRLFRIYAHIYHSHFKDMMALGLEAHLNTCFKHFVYFIDSYKLVNTQDAAPLNELIQEFKARRINNT